MAEVTDYYELLGVPETASPAAIKRAYRVRARASHPDHHPGDPHAEDRFKALQRAYQTLSDPARRGAYDEARRDWGDAFDGVGFDAPFSGRPDPLVSLFFGEDPPTTGVGSDVEARVRLTFDQALRGGKTEVRLGGGESVRLTVPKGVRSGLKVRVKGHGKAGPSGRGDLYVTFRVDPAGRFRREGDNLHLVETVSAVEAMLGTTREVTTAHGKTVRLKIKPGTQPGARLRLKGHGVETAKATGDLYVEVDVDVPTLSPAARESLKAWADAEGV